MDGLRRRRFRVLATLGDPRGRLGRGSSRGLTEGIGAPGVHAHGAEHAGAGLPAPRRAARWRVPNHRACADLASSAAAEQKQDRQRDEQRRGLLNAVACSTTPAAAMASRSRRQERAPGKHERTYGTERRARKVAAEMAQRGRRRCRRRAGVTRSGNAPRPRQRPRVHRGLNGRAPHEAAPVGAPPRRRAHALECAALTLGAFGAFRGATARRRAPRAARAPPRRA